MMLRHEPILDAAYAARDDGLDASVWIQHPTSKVNTVRCCRGRIRCIVLKHGGESGIGAGTRVDTGKLTSASRDGVAL